MTNILLSMIAELKLSISITPNLGAVLPGLQFSIKIYKFSIT